MRLGQERRGSEAASGGRRDLRRYSGSASCPALATAATRAESWPLGAEPGSRELGAGKGWGLPGHSPYFSAYTMRPHSSLER